MVTKRFGFLVLFVILLYVSVLFYIQNKNSQNLAAITKADADIEITNKDSSSDDVPAISKASAINEASVFIDTPAFNNAIMGNDVATIGAAPVVDNTQATEREQKTSVLNPNTQSQISSTENSIVTEEKFSSITVISKNELGFDVEQAYISDLKTYWHFRSLYYNYVFNDGKIGARINHSSKFGSSGDQYQIAGYSKIFNKIYGALSISGAKKTQIQYPNFQYLVEAFYITDNNLELYLGQEGRIYSMFSNQKIYTYSASIGKYFDNYFAFAKINNYSVQGEFLYLLGIRRYFVDKYYYISLNLNFGKTPDIGDLPPLDQLFITKQKGIVIDSQFPIINQLYISLALSYTRQVYPRVIRRILDGKFGLMLRF